MKIILKNTNVLISILFYMKYSSFVYFKEKQFGLP